LGSAFAFTFVAAPAVFSADAEKLLGPNYYHYFAGKIAGFIIHRAFNLQLVCGILALLHSLLERLYFGKPPTGLRLGLLVGLLVLTLFGALIAQPRIQSLHETRYAVKATPTERESARESFRTWHGVSQGVNVFLLIGLAIYTGRVGQRPE
jgi:hypothetical protein